MEYPILCGETFWLSEEFLRLFIDMNGENERYAINVSKRVPLMKQANHELHVLVTSLLPNIDRFIIVNHVCNLNWKSLVDILKKSFKIIEKLKYVCHQTFNPNIYLNIFTNIQRSSFRQSKININS